MLSGQGIKAADEIKVANQLTLRWGDYPGYLSPGRINVITSVLINEARRQESECHTVLQHEKDSTCHCWL